MKNFTSQSGQATVEMAIMLLAFVVLMLGLIFTLSLEIYNTRTLLDSKYQTERSVNFANAALHGGAGKEIKGWEYENGIPFTLKDQAIYHSGDEMVMSHTALNANTDSGSNRYSYEWTKLQEFPGAKFTADYKDRENSSIAAANLITRQGEPEGRSLTAKLPEFTAALANLLGLRIDQSNLRNNPSNRVYLPANGEL